MSVTKINSNVQIQGDVVTLGANSNSAYALYQLPNSNATITYPYNSTLQWQKGSDSYEKGISVDGTNNIIFAEPGNYMLYYTIYLNESGEGFETFYINLTNGSGTTFTNESYTNIKTGATLNNYFQIQTQSNNESWYFFIRQNTSDSTSVYTDVQSTRLMIYKIA